MNHFDSRPELPPVKPDPKLVVMRDNEGRATIVDPSVPENLTVGHVLGEHGTHTTHGLEVDGQDIFSTEPDGTLVATDEDGQVKIYDPASRTWIDRP